MSLKLTVYTFLFWLWIVPVFGQDIKLGDVSKIQLNKWVNYENAPKRNLEVVQEGGTWKCYQLKLVEEKPVFKEDSVRRFIKTVSTAELRQLLKYINSPDTILKPELFNASTTELVREIDSLKASGKRMLRYRPLRKDDSITAYLTDEQRKYFVKVIKNKQAVKDAVSKSLFGTQADDPSYYQIIITHKNYRKDTVIANRNTTGAYHLPWIFRGKKNYNSRLTELFYTITGNHDYVAKERHHFIYGVDYQLFVRWVGTKIYWDDYKKNHPSNYASLNETLSPAEIYPDGVYGKLRSVSMPFNIQLQVYFWPDYTLNTHYYNKTEKDMVVLYKHGGFLFDYLKRHPTYIASYWGSVAAKTIKQVQVIYPPIAKLDSTQIKRLYIASDYYQKMTLNMASGWLLLPDGTTILTMCSDKLINSKDKVFSTLTPKGKFSSHFYCIVFDKTGKRIAGDETPVRIEVN